MERLNITLTEPQILKLVKKQPFQVKHHQIADNVNHPHYLMLNKTLHKHASKAKMTGKGLRFPVLTDEEISQSGGFWDIVKRIGSAAVNAAKYVKDNIVDTTFYQENVRPELKKLVSNVKSDIATVLPTSISNIANKGIDVLADKTNAFG